MAKTFNLQRFNLQPAAVAFSVENGAGAPETAFSPISHGNTRKPSGNQKAQTGKNRKVSESHGRTRK
jgi:hypothetical protein